MGATESRLAIGVVVDPVDVRAGPRGDDGGCTGAVAVSVSVGEALRGCATFIDRGGAVVVEAVAELRRTRMDGIRSVVAVGVVGDGSRWAGHARVGSAAARTERVSVRVRVAHDRGAGEVLVDHAVAVVVDRVADLGGCRTDRGGGVVAVEVVRDASDRAATEGSDRGEGRVAIAVVVAVDEAREHHASVVHHRVAVVVDRVAADLGDIGVDGRVHVVAVTRLGDLTGIAHGLVADGGRTSAIGVVVGVDVAGDDGAGETIVDGSVAVVVDGCRRIAGLGSTRMDAGTGTHRVVAVVVQSDLACGAGRGGRSGDSGTGTVTVAVRVHEAGDARADEEVVGGTAAVVVDGIAELERAGMNQGRRVVAVTGGDRSIRRANERREGGARPRTEAVGVAVVVAGDRGADESAVDDAVAVVVDRSTDVADLGGARMDGRARDGIVTVAADLHLEGIAGEARTNDAETRSERIAVDVGEAAYRLARVSAVDEAVAVVVDAVADLDHAGMDGSTARDRIVAVTGDADGIGRARESLVARRRAEAVAVTVRIGVARHAIADDVLVDRAVAVVVDLSTDIADLGSTRMDADPGHGGIVAVTDLRRLACGADRHVGQVGARAYAESVAIGVGSAGDALADDAVVGHAIAVVVEHVAGFSLRRDRHTRIGPAGDGGYGQRGVAEVGTGLLARTELESAGRVQQVVRAGHRRTGGHADGVDAWRELVLPAERTPRESTDGALVAIRTGTGIVAGHGGDDAGALGPRSRNRVRIAVLPLEGQVRRRTRDRAEAAISRQVAGRRAGTRQGIARMVDVGRVVGTASSHHDETETQGHRDDVPDVSSRTIHSNLHLT